MIAIRAVRPADAPELVRPELVRLGRLMFFAMNGRDDPGLWERDAEEVVRAQLAEPGPRPRSWSTAARGGWGLSGRSWPGPAGGVPGRRSGVSPRRVAGIVRVRPVRGRTSALRPHAPDAAAPALRADGATQDLPA